MKRKIALAGNPNSGKTSLFNELTGASQYVGNWPGVTVERKSGRLVDQPEVEIQDLPGIYSLSPYTPEEVVTRHYLLNEKPDIVINVVDATNLERNLYLTSQLLETGLPIIVALNMIDLLNQRGDSIDTAALSRELGCPVLPISALHQTGLQELVEAMTSEVLPAAPKHLCYPPAVENVLENLCARYNCNRLQAVKMLENDTDMLAERSVTDRHNIETERLQLEKELEDDMASIIASGRYDAITAFVPQVLKRARQTENFSNRMDALLTHRVLGLGIFVLIMWGIYYLSITTVGDWGTGWANDVLFGPVVSGWLAGFIGNEAAGVESMTMFSSVLAMCLIFPATLRRLHDLGRSGAWLYLALAPFLLEYVCPHLPDVLHQILMWLLLGANAVLLGACLLLPGQNRINNYGLRPLGISFRGMRLSGRANRREYLLWFIVLSAVSFGAGLLGTLCLDCSAQLNDLITNGIVAGVGAVLGFLPQMAVLFLLLSLLEDCGYMARVAFMMDRIFRAIGLSGKSFIPLMVAMGCGVPGIMATRTIENEKDRRMSIMLTGFIPCGAKLPIIALLGAIAGQDATMATIAYFGGIASVILGGLMLRKTHMFAGGYTPFVMELPAYHMPAGATINLRAMQRCQAFVQKAGTVIFLASALIWFTSNYNWSMNFLNTAENEEAVEQSMLADTGRYVAPLFSPLGWGDWKPAVATVTGLIAKENVVGTFGVLYGTAAPEQEAPATGEAAEAAEDELPRTATLPKCNALSALAMAAWQGTHAELRAPLPAEDEGEEEEEEDETYGIAKAVAATGTFSGMAGLSFMLFNLLCAPCFAACGAIRREMNSARWTWFAIGYMCVWAYVVSLLTYQLGTWITQGSFGTGQIAACGIALLIAYMLLRRNPNALK